MQLLAIAVTNRKFLTSVEHDVAFVYLYNMMQIDDI